MDLSQVKLNKTEWDSIEIPLRPEELRVVKLLMSGYTDLWIKINHNTSLACYLRLSDTIDGLHDYLFHEYFEKTIRSFDPTLLPTTRKVKMRKGDLMKINLNKADDLDVFNVYESKLLELMRNICKCHAERKDFHVDYFTLYNLRKNFVPRMNTHVLSCLDTLLERHADTITVNKLVLDAHNVIEKNKMLIHNEDTTLYSHQRDIFQKLQNPTMKERLVKYMDAQSTHKTTEAEFITNPSK